VVCAAENSVPPTIKAATINTALRASCLREGNRKGIFMSFQPLSLTFSMLLP